LREPHSEYNCHRVNDRHGQKAGKHQNRELALKVCQRSSGSNEYSQSDQRSGDSGGQAPISEETSDRTTVKSRHRDCGRNFGRLGYAIVQYGRHESGRQKRGPQEKSEQESLLGTRRAGTDDFERA